MIMYWRDVRTDFIGLDFLVQPSHLRYQELWAEVIVTKQLGRCGARRDFAETSVAWVPS
jgi:hypothetical protein